MKIRDFLSESINDKGIFKAVFMAGVPGSGKTYTSATLTNGTIPLRVVNTDVWYPMFKKNWDMWDSVDDKTLKLTKEQLTQYLNSCLPLLIDSTSGSQSRLIRRRGILESFGYDTSMIWVNTSLDVAIKRASQRDRKVDKEYIIQIHNELSEVKEYYRSKFSLFIEVDNNDDKLDNHDLTAIYDKMKPFFLGDIINPLGKRYVKLMRDKGWKYLMDGVISIEDIKKSIDTWYLA